MEPFTYLRHVFECIPSSSNVDDFEVLLPWRLTPDMLPKVKPVQ
ncbi:MAG: transposase domain-containing protein [Magnetococcales bacterium]|nr:transposase domain-containing protein [Magnetococcales bacterium]